MKKSKKLFFVAVLMLTAIIIISIDEFKEEDVFLEAAYVAGQSDGFVGNKGLIEAAAYYGNMYIDDDEKIRLLKELAKELGVTDELKMSSEREKNRETITLSKVGRYSDMALSIVTLEEKDELERYSFAQYIICKISIDNSPESLCYYADSLRRILNEKNLTADVTSTLVSYFDGELDVKKCSVLADKMLKSMDAEVVAENRTKELFSVYAYSRNIAKEEAINLGSTKANINIAANYNEGLNQTRIYLATPILDIEY